MRRILLLSFFLTASLLFAQNGRTIIPLDSRAYELIDALYAETGLVPPNDARPWSAGELDRELDRLVGLELSEVGETALTELRKVATDEEPTFSEEDFTFNADITLHPEFFYHGEISDSEDLPDSEYEWEYDYGERHGFLEIPLELWYADSLYLLCEINAKEEIRSVTTPDHAGVAANHFNVILDDEEPWLDIYFPYRALSAAGGDWWTVVFGRDKLSWGNGRTGNLMLSDASDFYDFLELAFHTDSFKLTNVFMTMDRFLPDGTDIGYMGFIGHRFEFRLWERIKVAVSESVTVDGVQGSSTVGQEPLRDFNFLMIFHNWTIPERTNSLLSLDVSYTPWRYFTLYGQAAMDELATQYEQDRGGGGGPPIFGYLAGIEGVYPVGPGYLTAGFEAAQMSPWLYNRRESPYYYNTRRYWSLITDQYEYVATPLGYGYGADSVVLSLAAGYEIPGSLKISGELRYQSLGELNDPYTAIGAWDPAEGDASPSGIAENQWAVGLGAEYPLGNFGLLHLDLFWSATENAGNLEGATRSDIEIAGGVRWSF